MIEGLLPWNGTINSRRLISFVSYQVMKLLDIIPFLILHCRRYEKKMTKKFISRSEEYILLAVLHLGEDAYGVAVRNQLKMFTGESWAFGAVHVMLSRLEKKGLLTSLLTEPVSQRGGRSKRVFRLTSEGHLTLEKIKKVHDRVWSVHSESS